MRFKTILLTAFILLACSEKTDNDDIIEDQFCDSLMIGIKTLDDDYVRPIINNLLADLEPVPSDSDPLGHEENLNTLVNRLNDMCDNMIFSLFCYGCIYTNPLQSEIEMLTDSYDIQIRRIIDILTPGNELLSFAAIHGY